MYVLLNNEQKLAKMKLKYSPNFSFTCVFILKKVYSFTFIKKIQESKR